MDRDKEILESAKKYLEVFRERFYGVNINYRNASLEIIKKGGELFDSALIDLGISMYHYKESKRGFTFSQKERLDMRLDSESESVYDIINTYSFESLSNIFFKYGEERFARIIAKKIILERQKNPIEYSDHLAEIIAGAIPAKFKKNKKIHPATKCFQALRIYANNELENIEIGIPKIISLLKKGGRLGVITFHSIEDRIVKKIFSNMYKDCICPPEVPVCGCGKRREINWVSKLITPSENEIKLNPPSRSSKLRVVEKL